MTKMNLVSRKIKKMEISDEKKNKIYKKIKREFIFEHLVYTNYDLLPAVEFAVECRSVQTCL